ncbi:MAG: ribonuclease M5 [Myxococcota bacterium]
MIVVVEGVNDRAAVRRALDVDVITTGGFDFGPDVEAQLRRGQQTRGLVVLTDPDHAGEQIRRRVEALVGSCAHARVPREACRRRGRLGVEYASPRVIRRALAEVRASSEPRTTFTMADLWASQLTGHPNSRARREALGTRLSIGYANAKQLLVRLHALGVSREEFELAIALLDP